MGPFAGCRSPAAGRRDPRSEEHTSELQSQSNLVCRLLLEKKNRTLTDASSGYQFPENAVYDPTSTYTDANGRLMRTQYQVNVVPQRFLDPVAAKIQQLIPA